MLYRGDQSWSAEIFTIICKACEIAFSILKAIGQHRVKWEKNCDKKSNCKQSKTTRLNMVIAREFGT